MASVGIYVELVVELELEELVVVVPVAPV